MTKPRKEDFDYDYEKYQAIIASLDVMVKTAMRFIAQNESLDAFMGDIVFNRGEPAAARELRKRMIDAQAPEYLIAALTTDDLIFITNIYNHPISLLLKDTDEE